MNGLTEATREFRREFLLALLRKHRTLDAVSRELNMHRHALRKAVVKLGIAQRKRRWRGVGR